MTMARSDTAPHPAPPAARIRDAVGDCRTNRPEDVLWAKAALHRLGRYNDRGERHPYIDRALHDAILAYQRDRGWRRDGFMAPGGETECTICVELTHLSERESP
jgi:hypothetical protein